MGLFAYFSLGCLMAGLSLTGSDAVVCDMEWLPFNDHCYKLFPNKVTWIDAVTACQNECPCCQLASIQSKQESDVLGKYLSKYNTDNSRVWIGLYDPRKNQQWRWIDNSPVSYLAWNNGEPNNRDNEEYCVNIEAFKGYTKWNDLTCSNQLSYLCKY